MISERILKSWSGVMGCVDEFVVSALVPSCSSSSPLELPISILPFAASRFSKKS